MTLAIAFMTESRIVACCALRSRSGTAMATVRNQKRSKLLKIYASSSYLGPEWEGDLSTRLGRFVNAQDQFERLPSCPPVRVRLCLAAQDRQHVPVVPLMSKAVDVRRIRVCRRHELVVIIVFRELPVLDLVHCRPADFDRPLLAEHCDRTLEVPGIRQHRDFDRPQCTRAEFENRYARILCRDSPRQGGSLRHHA